jgi:hypothetical protein
MDKLTVSPLEMMAWKIIYSGMVVPNNASKDALEISLP